MGSSSGIWGALSNMERATKLYFAISLCMQIIFQKNLHLSKSSKILMVGKKIISIVNLNDN